MFHPSIEAVGSLYSFLSLSLDPILLITGNGGRMARYNMAQHELATSVLSVAGILHAPSLVLPLARTTELCDHILTDSVPVTLFATLPMANDLFLRTCFNTNDLDSIGRQVL